MQTIDFIKTAKWIVGLFSKETTEIFFSPLPFRRPREKQEKSTFLSPFIKASHEVTLAIDKILGNPLAPEVLRAFYLEELLKRSFPVEVVEAIASAPESELGVPAASAEPRLLLRPLWDKWEVFTSCIEPVEKITIPKDVIEEQDFDETLTIELQYEHDIAPKAETIADALTSLNQLYAALAIVYGFQDFPSLRIMYADSGSSVRFDLKGLGDPIKRIKEFFVEGWNLIRHRRIEDFRQNNKALLESLESIKRIQSMLEQGSLGGEDASRLKRQVIESALSLFEAGVLPREIPKYELVPNEKLMAEIQRKLLPPAPVAPDETKKKSTSKGSAKHSRASRKKRPSS